MSKLEAFGLDQICQLLADGVQQHAIASHVGVSPGTLSDWLRSNPERSARARAAKSMSAALWDEKAELLISGALDPFELAKAKELAHHYRWRASKIAPKDYGERVEVEGAVTHKVESVTLAPLMPDGPAN